MRGPYPTLEKQMDVVRDEENADFELMHDIMLYMTHYPDRTHHPMEDLVFQKLTSLHIRGGHPRRPLTSINGHSRRRYAVAAFLWAIRSGQFDDLEGPAHRILLDDDEHLEPPRSGAESGH